MIDFLITHWEGIAAIVGSSIAYIAGKRTRKAQQEKAGANALSAMQESYAKFVEDQANFVEDQNKRYEDLQSQIAILKEEVRSWKKKYEDLKNSK